MSLTLWAILLPFIVIAIELYFIAWNHDKAYRSVFKRRSFIYRGVLLAIIGIVITLISAL